MACRPCRYGAERIPCRNAGRSCLYAARQFYGLNFLYAGAAAVLLSGSRWQRNVGLVLAGLFLLLSVRQDFYAQKVWQLGKTAEERLVERVSAQIEAVRPHTEPLTPVVAGELPLRPRYYAENMPFPHRMC